MGPTLKRLGFDSYEEYVTSPLWQARRRRYYARHPRQCFVCEATRSIFLHHRSYRNLGNEQDRDLVPLCKRCHSLVHDTHAGLNRVVRRMRQRYLTAGELALTPGSVRPKGMVVLNAARLSEAERAKYAL